MSKDAMKTYIMESCKANILKAGLEVGMSALEKHGHLLECTCKNLIDKYIDKIGASIEDADFFINCICNVEMVIKAMKENTY